MAMDGEPDAQIAAAAGIPETEVRSVREGLGVAETRPEPSRAAPEEEISPARQAARGHLEDIRATLARLEPRETQQRSGAHQEPVGPSELETNAERLRRTTVSSCGLSDYLAQPGRMTAQVRAQVEARDALRRRDEQHPSGLDVYDSQRAPPRPGWAEAPGRELSRQQEQELRDELRSQWENRPRTGLVSRPPLKAVPKSQRPGLKGETPVRGERGRSRRLIAD
jgi:hypothetical protein